MLRVLNFERKQQTYGFDALPTPVHVVPQEKIAAVRRHAPVLKKPQHVVVLSVDVSAHFNWRTHLHQHRLLHEDVLDCTDRPHDIGLLEHDQSTWLGCAHLQQRPDHTVDVHLHFLLHHQL